MHEVVMTHLGFLEEVALSAKALKAGVHLQQLTALWADLCAHVATLLKAGKVLNYLNSKASLSVWNSHVSLTTA